MPGTNPKIASSPNRQPTPGTRKTPSIQSASNCNSGASCGGSAAVDDEVVTGGAIGGLRMNDNSGKRCAAVRPGKKTCTPRIARMQRLKKAAERLPTLPHL